MNDFVEFKVAGVAENVVQTLLDGKKAARTVENICDSLGPLIDNPETVKVLEEIREQAGKMAHTFQRIYTRNAREIFSGHRQPGDRRRTDRDSEGSTHRNASQVRPEGTTSQDKVNAEPDTPPSEQTR